MKKHIFLFLLVALSTSVLFLTTSCDKSIKSNVPVFNVNKFEENIKKAMDNKVVGYQYCISKDGKLAKEGFGGLAVKAADARNGLDIPQSPTKPQHVASVSKFITAIAVHKFLHDKNMSVEDLMYQYLPDSWEIGPAGTTNITFENLLKHTSGFTGVGSGYLDLKAKVKTGVTYEEVGDYDYENANFAMFRIIIPWMTQNSYLKTIQTDDALMETETRRIFAEYVFDNVLKPAGLKGAAIDYFKPQDTDPTFYYDFLNPEDGAWTNTEYAGLGGYGLYISSRDLCAVMSYLMHTETYFPKSVREKMINEGLGARPTVGKHGTYAGHGGDWYTSSNGRGLATGVLTFPLGVEAALLINCRDGNHAYQTTVLKDAYDNAWE